MKYQYNVTSFLLVAQSHRQTQNYQNIGLDYDDREMKKIVHERAHIHNQKENKDYLQVHCKFKVISSMSFSGYSIAILNSLLINDTNV